MSESSNSKLWAYSMIYIFFSDMSSSATLQKTQHVRAQDGGGKREIIYLHMQ